MKENEIKTRVFLTGATGVMGYAGLRELFKYPERYEVTVLARNTKKNRKKLKEFVNRGLKVAWGDLLDGKLLGQCIENSDIVLHVGGMVSPQAEHHPETTMKVNVGSMKLITNKVKELEYANPQRSIKTVYIGSVAQYGSNMPPNHWGNADNPQIASKLDCYSESKIKAEEELRKAGLKKWVSIRQTAILHNGLLKKANNPVAFHTPLNGVLEWISTEDSGRLLERICRKEVPEDFWCKCYNAGGGESYRKINIEFERAILQAMGCPPPEKIFEPNWFATQNFHGMWFEDSDNLNDILHFRGTDTFEDTLEKMKKSLPFYYRLAPVVPSFLIKKFMKRVALKKGLGTLGWIKSNDEEKINAYWGNIQEYQKIGGWDEFKELKLERKHM